MTTRTIIAASFVASGVLLVAGCDRPGGEAVELKNVSVAEAAKQAQAANKLEPGQWQTSMQVVSVDIPGAPKEVADALGKSVSAKTQSTSNCVTPEEASKPPADMLTGGPAGECRYDKFSMVNGTMDAQLVCKNPGAQAGEVRMTMAGQYTPTEYAFDMTMNMAGAGMPGGQGMTMKAKASGKRTGECAAGAG